MYSPLGLAIFVAVERTFVCFTKGQDHLFQILFVAAAYEQTNAISHACEAAYRNALAILAVVTLLGGIELLLLIYAVRVCRSPSLLAIHLLDTLSSKKWCGIHSLQWSTIPRIGRHSAGYS